MRFGATSLLALLLLAPTFASAALLKDVAYGTDANQKFDVYAPEHVRGSPIIVMVHGGGWHRGDKDMSRVVEAKSIHYNERGYVFVTVNYRMDKVTPLQEAEDIQSAVNAVQARAAEWGGDPRKVILMGHSAGAHLVVLMNARAMQTTYPWLGTVSLDSGALNVPEIMEKRHLRLYDRAFGADKEQWNAASPYQQLHARMSPILLVCSSRRDVSCAQSEAFRLKATELGSVVSVLPQDMSHGEINADLGESGAYTDAVDQFIASSLR